MIIFTKKNNKIIIKFLIDESYSLFNPLILTFLFSSHQNHNDESAKDIPALQTNKDAEGRHLFKKIVVIVVVQLRSNPSPPLLVHRLDSVLHELRTCCIHKKTHQGNKLICKNTQLLKCIIFISGGIFK